MYVVMGCDLAFMSWEACVLELLACSVLLLLDGWVLGGCLGWAPGFG